MRGMAVFLIVSHATHGKSLDVIFAVGPIVDENPASPGQHLHGSGTLKRQLFIRHCLALCNAYCFNQKK